MQVLVRFLQNKIFAKIKDWKNFHRYLFLIIVRHWKNLVIRWRYKLGRYSREFWVLLDVVEGVVRVVEAELGGHRGVTTILSFVILQGGKLPVTQMLHTLVGLVSFKLVNKDRKQNCWQSDVKAMNKRVSRAVWRPETEGMNVMWRYKKDCYVKTRYRTVGKVIRSQGTERLVMLWTDRKRNYWQLMWIDLSSWLNISLV